MGKTTKTHNAEPLLSACIDHISRSWWMRPMAVLVMLCFALNIAPPYSINPCSVFFLHHPHACLSPVLYSRVFLVMLYLTLGKREKWNHCTGIAVRFLLNAATSSQYVNVGQDSIILGVGEFDGGQFVPCESLFFFSVETRKTQSLCLQFFHTHTQLDTLCVKRQLKFPVSHPSPN